MNNEEKIIKEFAINWWSMSSVSFELLLDSLLLSHKWLIRFKTFDIVWTIVTGSFHALHYCHLELRIVSTKSTHWILFMKKVSSVLRLLLNWRGFVDNSLFDFWSFCDVSIVWSWRDSIRRFLFSFRRFHFLLNRSDILSTISGILNISPWWENVFVADWVSWVGSFRNFFIETQSFFVILFKRHRLILRCLSFSIDSDFLSFGSWDYFSRWRIDRINVVLWFLFLYLLTRWWIFDILSFWLLSDFLSWWLMIGNNFWLLTVYNGSILFFFSFFVFLSRFVLRFHLFSGLILIAGSFYFVLRFIVCDYRSWILEVSSLLL